MTALDLFLEHWSILLLPGQDPDLFTFQSPSKVNGFRSTKAPALYFQCNPAFLEGVSSIFNFYTVRPRYQEEMICERLTGLGDQFLAQMHHGAARIQQGWEKSACN